MQEYCNGGSLRSLLNSGAFAQPSVRSHWRSAMLCVKAIAAGMEYVHGKRICHGDLNPSNILLHVRPPVHRTAMPYTSCNCGMLQTAVSTPAVAKF